MLLHHSIDINAPASRVFEFFQQMQANYESWHPDHHAFRWLRGDSVRLGTVFQFDETIHGQRQRKTMRFTEVEPGRLLAFEPTNWFIRLLMPRLMFRMEPTGEVSCRFEAEIRLRVGLIYQKLNAKEFDAVRQHMREEGQNLKRIVEDSQ